MDLFKYRIWIWGDSPYHTLETNHKPLINSKDFIWDTSSIPEITYEVDAF